MIYTKSETQLLLHPNIEKARKSGRSSLKGMGTLHFEGPMAPLIEAGYILREDPGSRLASQPLPAYAETTVERVFRKVVNASLDPIGTGNARRFTSGGMLQEQVCSYAEITFARLHASLEQGSLETGRLFLEDGDPLVIQKATGAETGMLLREAVVDGIPYPAGSIMGLHVAEDVDWRSNPGISVADAGQIAYMGFMRLSMFGLEPTGERDQYMSSWDNLRFDPTDRNRIALSDIQTLTAENVYQSALDMGL